MSRQSNTNISWVDKDLAHISIIRTLKKVTPQLAFLLTLGVNVQILAPGQVESTRQHLQGPFSNVGKASTKLVLMWILAAVSVNVMWV